MKWGPLPDPNPEPTPNPVSDPSSAHPESFDPDLLTNLPHPGPPPLLPSHSSTHLASPTAHSIPSEFQSGPSCGQLRIILPKDVATCDDLRRYFQQRLGPDFDQIPFMMMEPGTYLDLTQGEDALLAQMIEEDRPAADDIFVAFTGEEDQLYVIMTFHIETPNVGERTIAYIREHQTNRLHGFWLTEMEQLAFKMQKLHRQWRRQSPLYHILQATEVEPEKEK